jgi:hypothetical protein
MKSQRFVRAGRIGAIYDLAVTALFATPWTAALVLRVLGKLHDSLGLPGEAMPKFDTSHMLYVTLFGIIVTLWSVVRVLRPIPLLIAADTIGRAAFSLTFIWSLTQGHSAVVVPFLVLEVAFLVYQALGVRAALRADRKAVASHPVGTGTPVPVS